jgi:hypothetical protein
VGQQRWRCRTHAAGERKTFDNFGHETKSWCRRFPAVQIKFLSGDVVFDPLRCYAPRHAFMSPVDHCHFRRCSEPRRRSPFIWTVLSIFSVVFYSSGQEQLVFMHQLFAGERNEK